MRQEQRLYSSMSGAILHLRLNIIVTASARLENIGIGSRNRVSSKVVWITSAATSSRKTTGFARRVSCARRLRPTRCRRLAGHAHRKTNVRVRTSATRCSVSKRFRSQARPAPLCKRLYHLLQQLRHQQPSLQHQHQHLSQQQHRDQQRQQQHQR